MAVRWRPRRPGDLRRLPWPGAEPGAGPGLALRASGTAVA